MPYYLNNTNEGLKKTTSLGDGSSIKLDWYSAYPSNRSNKIAYNIYVDTNPITFEDNFFNKTPVFISVGGATSATITGLTPGVLYHFGVRAVEYDPSSVDFSKLPQQNGIYIYPSSLLRSSITATSSIIPLADAEFFPNHGVIKIGVELIYYSSVDYVNNNLLLNNPTIQRGYNGTTATFHTTDGYDGYTYWDPSVIFYPIDSEEQNTVVFECQNRFDVGNYSFTLIDGYHQKTKDILNTDLSGSDAGNVNFPSYDYSGYHRTDPTLLFSGACVGSYIGGEYYCADGYSGVGRKLRGLNLQNINDQRQEQLLLLTGEPCCIIRRNFTGITCDCYIPGREYPESRCESCFGTGQVVGYIQLFNFGRRSDLRFLIRFSPADDQVKMLDTGLESELNVSAWTLTYPSIHSRDVICRFDENGNDEFRYEVISVNRNKMMFSLSGGQHMSLQRIRKTDPIYQVPVLRDGSDFPQSINTSVGSAIPAIAPHIHEIVINEKYPQLLPQLTSVNAGHNHAISYDKNSGTITLLPELGHSHTIVYP